MKAVIWNEYIFGTFARMSVGKPLSHLCQMGASGNLCASVYVSIDENAEATRAVTTNVSSYRS